MNDHVVDDMRFQLLSKNICYIRTLSEDKPVQIVAFTSTFYNWASLSSSHSEQYSQGYRFDGGKISGAGALYAKQRPEHKNLYSTS